MNQGKKSGWSGILVYLQCLGGLLHPSGPELIGEARRLAAQSGEPVWALGIGSHMDRVQEALQGYPVDHAFLYETDEVFEPCRYASLVSACIRQQSPSVVLVGALRVNAGQMPAGQIVAFLSYFTLIQTATLGIAKVFIRISKGAASARRIEEILLEPEDQPLRPSEAVSEAELGMEGVSFSYQGIGRDLADVSFTLGKGETLGILGPTGSGKSTLAALLMRLYDAGEGIVWVGGRDVNSVPGEERRFGVVFQNEALLNDSVYENISFLRNIPREDVIAAAKTAQAWDFIQGLPEGLDSRLDIRGANLSGGQRQRLLTARALAGKPAVLVLDSADSALDYATAGALRRAIRRDCPGVTLVVISERVASLRCADRILVLEEGRVTAQGTHGELLERCARYRHIAELQRGVLL